MQPPAARALRERPPVAQVSAAQQQVEQEAQPELLSAPALEQQRVSQVPQPTPKRQLVPASGRGKAPRQEPAERSILVPARVPALGQAPVQPPMSNQHPPNLYFYSPERNSNP